VRQLPERLGELRQALAAESLDLPTLELARAILALGGAEDLASVLALAVSKPRLAGPLSAILARERGEEALELLGTRRFEDLSLSNQERVRFVRLATREDGKLLGKVFEKALAAADHRLWGLCLHLAIEQRYRVDPGILVKALEVTDPEMRIETAWFLAANYLLGPARQPEKLLLALEANAKLQPPAEADPDEAMGFELLARSLGRPATDNPGWIAHLGRTLGSQVREFDQHGVDFRALLTPAEIEALEAQEDRCSMAGSPTGSEPAAGGDPPALLETASELTPGLVASTLDRTKCDPGKKGQHAVARVTYDVSGRPYVQSWYEKPGKTACVEAAEALVDLALAPLDRPTGNRQPSVIALFLDRDAGACTEVDLDRAAVRLPDRCQDEEAGKPSITPPEIRKQVRPVYPDRAKLGGVEGLVVVEAIISPSGCIRRQVVRKAPSYELAMAAMSALKGWRFLPGKLDGQPVTVHFSLTVNFDLR
jgi:TonB family protein